MNSDCQFHVRREYIAGNPKYDFPVRPLGWVKLVGVVFVGFGLLFAWMPARWSWQAIRELGEGGLHPGKVVFNFFPLIFVLAAAIPVAVGLFILFGRSRLQWRDGELRTTEILGPFRWTRRMPRKPVRKLEVAITTSQTGNAPPKPVESFSGLTAEFADGSKKLLVLGYPKDWLLAIAEELKSYVGGGALSAAAVEVAMADQAAADPAVEDLTQQPADSRVQVEERGAGLRLIMPPVGIWRGTKGLLFFALFWCGFMVVFSIAMTKAILKEHNAEWGLLAFLVAFWAIGLGLLAAAIHLGRRTATLEVDAGRLCVETRGLFVTKRREWTRADLLAIRADGSNMKVNDRTLIELQIHPRVGKKVGLLAGRKDDELRWMATRLRRALNVPARQVGSD